MYVHIYVHAPRNLLIFGAATFLLLGELHGRSLSGRKQWSVWQLIVLLI